MPQARFQISPSPGGQFTFKLIAPNGETILTGERYANHTGAVGGITSVKANAPLEQRYERLLSRSNQPYFVLKAANGEIIGTSEMYSSSAARDGGIRSVMANAPDAGVEG